MAYRKALKNNLYEIADAVIEELKSQWKVGDPFTTTTLVFHNTKVAQWFKAYFLRAQEDVLMGVNFVTLSVFINDLVNPDRKYEIMDRGQMRLYILRALLSNSRYSYKSGAEGTSSAPGKAAAESASAILGTSVAPDKATAEGASVVPDKVINYIYNKDGSVNGNNAYEFADKLAVLFMNYEMDGADMSQIAGWEKDLYRDALKLAGEDNCFTTSALFKDTGKGITKKIDSPVYIINNSYFSALFEEMLESLNNDNVTVFALEEADEKQMITEPVISAPSEMRETEALHAKICELIRDGQIDHYNDIVVYAPDINRYANAVRRVFTQDNRDYPNIPFRIAGEVTIKKDMSDSLNILFDIANKGFFTRNDLYRFARNPLIKYVWKIEDEDIDAWMVAISATNAHRDSAISDDWNYIKKRLISGILVSDYADYENMVTMQDGSYLPYASIDMTKKRTNDLIDIINVLSQWKHIFADDFEVQDNDSEVKADDPEVQDNNLEVQDNDSKMQEFDAVGLERIKESLDAIYSLKKDDEEESNYLYIEISGLMDKLIGMDFAVPRDTLLQLIMDIPGSYTVNPADLYSGGVTFVNLRSDDIVAQKYAFIMGMSSDAFPRIEYKSELDFHDVPISNRELDEKSIDRIINNSQSVFFSYVNCDLSKDEPFYPSSSILSRVESSKVKDFKFQVKMPLDEVRDYGQLFTRTQFRSKAYFDSIGSTDDIDTEADSETDTFEADNAPATESDCGTDGTATTDENNKEDIHTGEDNDGKDGVSVAEDDRESILTLSEIKKFLECSYIYKYHKILHSMDDEGKDTLDEYEPIDIGKLEKYKIIKEMMTTDCADADAEDKMKLEKKLPEKVIGEAYWNYYQESSIRPIKEDFKKNYLKLDLKPLMMNAVDSAGNNIPWELRCNIDVWKKEDIDGWHYLEAIDYFPRKKDMKIESLGNGKFLNTYVAALMDVAVRKDTTDREIILGTGDNKREFSITSKDAADILNRIYLKATDYFDNRYTDIDIVTEIVGGKTETVAKITRSLGTVIGKIIYGNSWKYFSDKEMVNPYRDLGYDDKNYASIKYECKYMAGLLRFIPTNLDAGEVDNG